MPTERRIEATIVALSEVLEQIGYQIEETTEPRALDNENGDFDSAEKIYYLIINARQSQFYITFRTDLNYCSIVYPMDIMKHLSLYLDDEEVDLIMNVDSKWQNLNDKQKEELYTEAIIKIVNNTDKSRIREASFDLFKYASSPMIELLFERDENGFPLLFQCNRGIFPYTQELSMKEVDDRVFPVLVAGRKGRKFVEHSYRIKKEDREPDEYEFVSKI